MISKLLKCFTLMAFLTGCAHYQAMVRPETIRGETCRKSPNLKVFQVLNDGVLAYICPIDYPSYYDDSFDACITEGDLVYMPVRPETNDYVDDQEVTLAQTQCFVGDGTFSYTSTEGRRKTVRNIKILEKEPSPDEELKAQ